MEMVTWNHDGYFIRHGHDYCVPRYRLSRSTLYLIEVGMQQGSNLTGLRPG